MKDKAELRRQHLASADEGEEKMDELKRVEGSGSLSSETAPQSPGSAGNKLPSKERDADPRPSYLLTMVICVGAFGVGYAIGFTSPASHQLKVANGTQPQTQGQDIRLVDNHISWFGSTLFLAGMIGGAIGGPQAEKLGRKVSVIVTNIPLITGWLLIAFANSLTMLLIGRVCVGYSVGVAILLNPVYLAETVLPRLRGILTTCLQLCLALGIIVCFGLGNSIQYRHLAIIGAVIGGVYMLMLIKIPETPRWYFRHGESQKGIDAMQMLRGKNAVIADECAEIEASVLEDQRAEKFSLSELAEPSIYRPFMMSVALMMFQQWCGINAVLSYTTIIFAGAGLSDKASAVSIGVAGVQLLFTFLSVFIVDRYGRRPLLMAAGLGLGLSCAVMAIFFFKRESIDGTSAVVMPVLAIYVYMAAFSLGLGIIPWLFMAEAFPSRAFPVLSSLSASLCWLMAFVVTQYFSALSDLLGDGGVFSLLSAVSFMLIFFAKFVLVETKGLTLEEVEVIFSRIEQRGSVVSAMRPLRSDSVASGPASMVV